MASRCPESAALRQYYDKLVIAITATEQVIFASKLYSKNVVDANVVEEVLLQSTTPIVKGCNIVSAVQRKVEADPALFHQFTALLRDEEDDSLKSLGKQLHETYAETKRHFPVPKFSIPQITTPMASPSPLVPHCHSHTPSLEQCFTSAGISVDSEFLDQTITNSQHVADISKKLTKWQDLSPYLHIQEEEEEEIKALGNLSEQRKALLRVWVRKLGPEATYRRLCTVLWEQKRLDVVDTVCKVLRCSRPSCSFYKYPQCPICRYANYLRSIYKRSELAEYSNLACYKWMPCPGEKFRFINLTAISKKKLSNKEAERLKKEAIHGHIDLILKEKAPIALENILQVEQGQSLPCVLIEGAPGIGKSTLAWEICHRWGTGELFQEYSIVLLVTLRDERVQRATCVVDLFYHSDKKLQEEVVQEINTINGKGVLILLEGLDELPRHLLTEYSIFTDLLSGAIFPEATVLVTSRPSATDKLWQRWWQKKSRHIEILGFTEDKITEYTRSVLSDDQISGFHDYLSINSCIKSMMYVPLHCAIAVAVYLQCQQSDRAIPKTLTGLYTCLAQIILTQYLKDHSDYNGRECKFNSFSELPSPVYSHFKKLCHLAFYGVSYQQLIFRNIPQSLDSSHHYEHLGFMNAVPEQFSHLQQSANYAYNFLHLSVQEYLAAYHISLMSHSEQEQLLRTVSCDDHLFNMTRFLAGITQFKGLDEVTVKKVIGIKDSDGNCAEMSDYTLEFLYECQDVSILDSEHCYSVNINNSKYGLMALGYAVIRCNSKWKLTFSGIDSPYDFPNGSYNIESIKFISCSSEFINSFLLQLPHHVLAHIRSLTIESEYPLPSKQQLLPSCLPELLPKMECLNITLRLVNGGKLEYTIKVDSGCSDKSQPQLQPYNVDLKYDIAESEEVIQVFDQILKQLLQNKKLAHISSLCCNCKYSIFNSQYSDSGSLLPSLPKLVLRMGELETLRLENVKASSLTKLEISRVPTLMNLSTVTDVGNFKCTIKVDSGYSDKSQPQLQPYNVDLEYNINELKVFDPQQLLRDKILTHIRSFTCIGVYHPLLRIPSLPKLVLRMGRLESLKLENVMETTLTELDLSRILTLRKLDIFNDGGGLFEYSINIDSSNDNLLSHLCSCPYKQSYTCIFDHFLRSLLSANTLAHITSFIYNSDYKELWFPMLPSLPKLFLAMERLNTLELVAEYDTALAELVPALFATPTLKNVAVYSNSGIYKKEIPEPTDNDPINGTIHCSPNYDSEYYDEDEHIDMIDGILQKFPQSVLSHVTSFFFDFVVGNFKCSINVDSSNDTPLPQLQPHHVDLEHMGVCDSEKSIQLFDCFLQQLLPGIILPDIESFSCYGEIDKDDQILLPSYLPTLILRMERLNLVKLKSLTLHKLNSQDLTLLFQWQLTYQLETLTLPSLSPDHIQMVSRSLIPVSSLKTLDLQRSEFTFQSMQTFASILQHNQSLTKVDISDCSIDSDSACCLAEALHHNTTLRKLNMSRNPVGERRALAMAEMLKHNTTLEELDLRHAEISSDGAVAVAEALHHNRALRKLNMSGNPVGERKALVMAEMLKHNTTLEELDLRHAKISSDGAVAMAEALHHNRTLRKLNVSGNPVGERGALAMAEMLKHNTTLEELDLRCLEVSDKAIKTLIANLAVNHNLKKLIINWYKQYLVKSLPECHDHKERVKFSRV